MKHYVRTSAGGRSENQDTAVVFPFHDGKVYLLCDGMGGVGIGREASERVCQYIKFNLADYFEKYGRNWEETVKKILFDLNNQLCKKNPKMGTTVAMIYIDQNQVAHIAHVGDSRVYVIRNKSVIYRTEDDSYVAGLVRSGRISTREAWGHDKSNVVTNILGINLKLVVHFHSLHLRKGDKVLISTDGLHDVVQEDEILKKLSLPVDLTIRNSLLLRKAKKAGKKRNPTNYDNITFILIENPAISPVVIDVIRVVAILLILAFLINTYGRSVFNNNAEDQELAVADSSAVDLKEEIAYLLDNLNEIDNKDNLVLAYRTFCQLLPENEDCEQLIRIVKDETSQADRDSVLLMGETIFSRTEVDSIIDKMDLGELDENELSTITSLKSLIKLN